MAEHVCEIRAAPATEIDRWEAQVVAIEAHVGLGPVDSVERVAVHRRLVQAAASRIRRLVAHTETVTSATLTRLDRAFEGLRTALAAGRPGDPVPFAMEASPIADAVGAFEGVVDRAAEEGGEALIEDLGILARDFVATTDAYAAELAAAQWSAAGSGMPGERESADWRQRLGDDIGESREALRMARSTTGGDASDSGRRQAAECIARLRQTFLSLATQGEASPRTRAEGAIPR